MKPTLIKSISLENGLTLELYDASRRVAGDRWQVALAARIHFAVDDIHIGSNPDTSANAAAIKEALGGTIRFEQKRERNFIEESKKTAVLNNLIDSFLDSSQKYFSHPEFAKRFALKEYNRLLKGFLR